MLNNWTGAGRLTKDVEIRKTQGGKDVANFSVAIDRDFKSQDGERETDFVDIVAWGSTANFVSQYFQKGSMILIHGRLQIRNWKDEEGKNHTKAEIIAENVYFGGSKNEGGSTSGGALTNTNPKTSTESTYAPEEDSEDEESLPF